MDVIGGELGFMAASAGKAFLTLMEPHRLMFLALGCIMGLVLGIIPGIGGLTGTAMLLPFTFNMDPYSAFALLLGLGATTATGDPIPAVLFGVPGGAASAATVLDGFPMAKRGEAGRALSAAYMSSLMGGVFGAMLLAVSFPILRPVMLYLGSPELLAFSVLGISMVAVLSGSAPLRGAAAGCLGIMIAMIGSDPQTGTRSRPRKARRRRSAKATSAASSPRKARTTPRRAARWCRRSLSACRAAPRWRFSWVRS